MGFACQASVRSSRSPSGYGFRLPGERSFLTLAFGIWVSPARRAFVPHARLRDMGFACQASVRSSRSPSATLRGGLDRDHAAAAALAELHDPRRLGEERVVAADPDAFAGLEAGAALAHDD